MNRFYLTSIHEEFPFLHKIRECIYVGRAHIGVLYKGIVAKVFDDGYARKFGSDKIVFFCEIFENRIRVGSRPVFVGVCAIKEDFLSRKYFFSFGNLIPLGNGELYKTKEDAEKHILMWRNKT